MVKIIGHRGARNLWPENSLVGFRRTSALAIDGVEFDVHATRDGGIVVIHDPTLERTAHGNGPVCARTTAELGAIRLRDGSSETVPTLDTVLDLFQQSPFDLQIEIKTDVFGNPYPGIEAQIVEMVRRREMEDRVVFNAFVPAIHERVRRLWPEARLLASIDRRSAEMMGGLVAALDRFAAMPGCVMAVEKGLLAPMLPLCLDRFGGHRLGAWVPNEHEELEFWLKQPIYHVTTDRPDLALAARGESHKEGAGASTAA
jgi:glycerophosphoryl diester phosphodiesterase